jgi:hypothetical protein
MMKSSKKHLPTRDAATTGLANPEIGYIPREEESDTVCALLAQAADRVNHESTRFPYREDLEQVNYIDEQALHRIVEDLQFGHDLRL